MTPGLGIRDSGLGSPARGTLTPALTPGRNSNPECRMPDTRTRHHRGHIRPPLTTNQQSAIDNRQSPGPELPTPIREGSEQSRNVTWNQQITAPPLHQGFSTGPGWGIRSSGIGNRTWVALAMMPMITLARNPNPKPRILDLNASTSPNREQMPPPTINRQPAIANPQARIPKIPIPRYRTALLPCVQWPSASGSVAVTSPAKPDARAAK